MMVKMNGFANKEWKENFKIIYLVDLTLALSVGHAKMVDHAP